MGRRKERRLASKSAAGRRVKLDLFAEPSGDLGGSSAQEGVGGEGDSKTHAGLPSSPSSSSGQQPQNPLLLLEQYSDEELDEDSNEGTNDAVAEEASDDIDDEVKVPAGKETEDIENNAGKEPTIQKVEQLLMDNGSAFQDPSLKLEKGSIIEIDHDDLHRQNNKVEETTCPAAPDEQLVGDMNSGWKMVLHEESNQYYYWNIATGETSWEVPDVLAQENVVSVEKAAGDTEVMGTYKSSTPLDMEKDNISPRNHTVDSKVNWQTSDSAEKGTQTDGFNEGFKGDSIHDEQGNRDANLIHGTSLLDRHSGEDKSGTDLHSQLVKHCESLLEKLNSVKRLNCYLEGQDFKLKCELEIEIRLADIKALASHGSSLLPFWLHSEGQLNRLEASVDGVIQRHNSASASGFEATLESREGIGDDIDIDSSERKVLFPAGESHADHITKKSKFEAQNDGATTAESVPSAWYSSTSPVNDVGGNSEINGIEQESESTTRPILHSGEEVDMDVDMEVEDTSSIKSHHGGASDAYYHVSTELSNLHNILGDSVPGQVLPVPPVEEWIPPPPPDNEPFPPPPPDDEPFPPPPPEEPPETSYPPSHLESVQPFPYSEQYALPYPGSSLEYYGTNLEASGTTLYTHPEGGQVGVSHLPHYYEAVPNVYAVAPLVVDPVEPTAYYGLQNETLNPVSLVSSAAVESSGTQCERVPENLDSGTAGSLDYHADAGSNLLLKTNLNVINSGHSTVENPPEIPDAQPSTGAPATSSDSIYVSSTSDTKTSVSAAAAAATSKAQSKVSRGKKRTVAVVSTLRSNKKVSSLVDKWKAAKEELQEEEEEPEDDYEILEKKRQREIEEWRAQQIASGEAKDNANFQPLGGDWRERVKRKRAQKMKESGQSSLLDVSTNGNQQPDLVELSKGLPSGWQAYWDDSSKQVYYGNVWTSETTWTKPKAKD